MEERFQNVTMAAEDWISLLGITVKKCLSCGGYSPSVKDTFLDKTFFEIHGFFEDEIKNRWFLLNTDKVYGWGSVPPSSLRICHSCFVDLKKYKKQRAKLEKEKKEEKARKELEWLQSEQYRHVMVIGDARELDGGFVYVCRLESKPDIYKIGATGSWKNLKHRLSSQKRLSRSGLTYAINTHFPFELESYLHQEFFSLNVKDKDSREFFRLNEKSFKFIESLRLFSHAPVTVISAKSYLFEASQ